MKILFFIHSITGGGAERVLVNIANALVNKGYDISIAMAQKDIVYPIDKRVKITVFTNILKGTSKNIFSIIIRYIYNLYNIYINIKKNIRIEQPTVIVTFLNFGALPILLTHKKIPIISSEHNTFDRKHNFREHINRFLVNRFFDKVVALTMYDKVFMKKKLKNIEVIPNSLSYDCLQKDVYIKTFNNRKNILACGRITQSEVKGFDNLIISFSKISFMYPNWNLDIVGTGDSRELYRLMTLASQLNIANRVHFLGFISNINIIMQQHSIFVLSSKREGFPMSLVEAMSMGCACIAFDCITGPREIIVDSVDGVLVKNQSIEHLSKKMARLIENSSERYNMGLHAIENINRFHNDKIIPLWEDLFHEVIK